MNNNNNNHINKVLEEIDAYCLNLIFMKFMIILFLYLNEIDKYKRAQIDRIN